jgi:hypothetical protein
MIYDDRDQYTISVRWIVESYSQETPDITTDQKIAIALPKIFNFDFPMYDESYRTTFEEKLIRHFYFHEINITSIGRWKFMLREKLNLILPVYNKMYEAVAIKYDPLIDTQMHESYTRKNDLTSTSSNNTDGTQNVINNLTSDKTGTQSGTGSNVYSDLPQTTLHGGDYATNSTQTEDSATTKDTQKDNSTSNSTNNITQNSNANSNNTETYEHDNTGFSSRSQQELLMQYYEALRNVDEMVFNELRELFMLVY